MLIPPHSSQVKIFFGSHATYDCVPLTSFVNNKKAVQVDRFHQSTASTSLVSQKALVALSNYQTVKDLIFQKKAAQRFS